MSLSSFFFFFFFRLLYFWVFIFIFISTPRLQHFENFLVNQKIKKWWPKGSYNHVCKNMYFLFGTSKLEMNQMLFDSV